MGHILSTHFSVACTQNMEVLTALLPYLQRMNVPLEYYFCLLLCKAKTCKFHDSTKYPLVAGKFIQNFILTDDQMAAWDHVPVRPDGTLKDFAIEFRPDRLCEDNFTLLGAWQEMVEKPYPDLPQAGEFQTVRERELGK